jgi:hypothetical protein
MTDTDTSSKDEVTNLRKSDHEVISMRQSRSIRSQSIDISMQSKSQAEQNGEFDHCYPRYDWLLEVSFWKSEECSFALSISFSLIST